MTSAFATRLALDQLGEDAPIEHVEARAIEAIRVGMAGLQITPQHIAAVAGRTQLSWSMIHES